MNEIMNIVIANLTMVGVFLVPLALMRVADIALGTAIAKKNKVQWNWKKFLWGLFYTLCFLLGTGLFVTSISMIVPLIEVYGIVADEAVLTALNEISSIAVCLIILSVTVTSYGKDCCEKIKILISKDTNTVSDTSKRGNI